MAFVRILELDFAIVKVLTLQCNSKREVVANTGYNVQGCSYTDMSNKGDAHTHAIHSTVANFIFFNGKDRISQPLTVIASRLGDNQSLILALSCATSQKL